MFHLTMCEHKGVESITEPQKFCKEISIYLSLYFSSGIVPLPSVGIKPLAQPHYFFAREPENAIILQNFAF
jgi:hypothetical protein